MNNDFIKENKEYFDFILWDFASDLLYIVFAFSMFYGLYLLFGDF
jgi:hypothetical protein